MNVTSKDLTPSPPFEYSKTSARVTPCHTGSISCLPSEFCRCTRPSSSHCGQFLRKKFLLRITTPYRHFERPISIDRLRLSPARSENSSYQTSTRFCCNAAASGRTKSSLSSLAWEIKTSKSMVYSDAWTVRFRVSISAKTSRIDAPGLDSLMIATHGRNVLGERRVPQRPSQPNG